MSFVLRHMGNNLWSGQLDIFPEDRLIHGFSARHGGVSPVPFDTLNMALHVGDDPAHVWENRTRYLRTIGSDAARICTIRQVHGTEIVRVLRRDAGRGARDYDDACADADAMITNDSGVALLLCYADCVPVLLYDPVHNAAGLVHAGWKGTVQRIAAKTIARMGEEFGTKPSDVCAGIGPSISADCYVVGPEVADRFYAKFPAHANEILTKRDGAIHLDLWAANRIQLVEAGLAENNIDSANVCTSCDRTFFYSYRAAGGRTGRLAAVMELR
ncbi:MAG: peptidoglycan editing factor PgeF [Selenomonas noxia]|uniref:peptidoglycan editing factor PgeF n=1 Tax=Selenomonas noxia TaxID=135083 RepID=UPI003612788C